MKAKYKQKWLKALRSGKYKQGKEALYRDGRFCCLGVLCDIVKDELEEEWVSCPGDDKRHFFDGDTDYLPESVQQLTGVSDNYGTYRAANGRIYCLFELNDNGRSFREIADRIEKYF